MERREFMTEMNQDATSVVRAALQGCRPEKNECCLIINIFFPNEINIEQNCDTCRPPL
jgi:hypothetical protein